MASQMKRLCTRWISQRLFFLSQTQRVPRWNKFFTQFRKWRWKQTTILRRIGIEILEDYYNKRIILDGMLHAIQTDKFPHEKSQRNPIYIFWKIKKLLICHTNKFIKIKIKIFLQLIMLQVMHLWRVL